MANREDRTTEEGATPGPIEEDATPGPDETWVEFNMGALGRIEIVQEESDEGYQSEARPTSPDVIRSPPPLALPIPPEPKDALFDEFWEAYPRKVGKGAAQRAWRMVLRSGVDLEQVIVAAGGFRTECFARGTDKTYIPHPAKWLSTKRYSDETAAPGETATLPAGPPRPLKHLNDEQLLATVIRLTSDQDHPVTAANAIIHAVRQQAASSGAASFPEVDDERGRELADLPYPDYLRTPEWQERRRIILKRAGYRCQVCNRDRSLHVHHRTYERRGVELPGDLTALCDECHSLFHGRELIPAEQDSA